MEWWSIISAGTAPASILSIFASSIGAPTYSKTPKQWRSRIHEKRIARKDTLTVAKTSSSAQPGGGAAAPARTQDRSLGGLESMPDTLGPSGFDPAREAAALTPQERKYLLCTPLQQPKDAGLIAHGAGESGAGHRFAGFARRQAWLFQRLSNSYGTAFTYRLSEDGVAVMHAAIAMEARQGRDGETRLDPKDDSADPKGSAHTQSGESHE
jgi:hypothetical protein